MLVTNARIPAVEVDYPRAGGDEIGLLKANRRGACDCLIGTGSISRSVVPVIVFGADELDCETRCREKARCYTMLVSYEYIFDAGISAHMCVRTPGGCDRSVAARHNRAAADHKASILFII